MARTTIKVKLPKGNPDEVVRLVEVLLAQHNKLNTAVPNSSPVPKAMADQLQALLTTAKADRASAKEHERLAQAQHEKSNLVLGLAKGQTMRTEGTCMCLLGKARDQLLVTYKNQENALEPFGFKVVVGTAASPKRKTTPPAQ